MFRPLQQLARAVTAAALIAFTPVALLGQKTRPLETGTRIRIEARALADTMLIGNVAFLNRDTLTLAPPGRGASMIHIPTSAIERIEVSRGRGTRLSTAALGGLLGIAAGYSAGYALGGRDEIARVLGGTGGAALGLVVGAVVGSVIKTGPERWERHPLPARERALP
jgi:hypothetical protein